MQGCEAQASRQKSIASRTSTPLVRLAKLTTRSIMRVCNPFSRFCLIQPSATFPDGSPGRAYQVEGFWKSTGNSFEVAFLRENGRLPC